MVSSHLPETSLVLCVHVGSGGGARSQTPTQRHPVACQCCLTVSSVGLIAQCLQEEHSFSPPGPSQSPSRAVGSLPSPPWCPHILLPPTRPPCRQKGLLLAVTLTGNALVCGVCTPSALTLRSIELLSLLLALGAPRPPWPGPALCSQQGLSCALRQLPALLPTTPRVLHTQGLGPVPSNGLAPRASQRI